MWESPIWMIIDDTIKDRMQKQDELLMESVHRVGFNIDKDELVKVLNYDRDQYEKGYADGRLARDSEIVRCKDCRFSKHGDGDEWEEGVDGVCEYWDSDGIYPYDFCSQGKEKES